MLTSNTYTWLNRLVEHLILLNLPLLCPMWQYNSTHPHTRDTHGSRHAPLQPTVHILGKNKFCGRSATLCPVSCRPASHSASLTRSGRNVNLGIPMQNLVTTAPKVHDEFMAGKFLVKRTDNKFCQIPTDQTLQHISRVAKVSGGIVGITHQEAAWDRPGGVQQWTLTDWWWHACSLQSPANRQK